MLYVEQLRCYVEGVDLLVTFYSIVGSFQEGVCSQAVKRLAKRAACIN